MTDKEKEERIFKRLKQHLNFAKQTFPNNDIIYIALQGSQNYNLDYYTEEYTSDIDTKAIILPTLEDIVLNKKPVSCTLLVPTEHNGVICEPSEHCDVKDIRLMFDCFRKQNINFLEILFSKYKIINKEYKVPVNKLLDNNEIIARYNPPLALKMIGNMSIQKLNALCHPYPTIKDKIDKYGYDGKQLHHIIRLLDFINAYIQGMSYKECLIYRSGNKQLLENAKFNKFNLDEAVKLAEEYNDKINNVMYNILQQKYPDSKIVDYSNKNIDDLLNNITMDVFNIYLNKDKSHISKPIYPTNYPNVFVTSDLHFGHKNIMKYETGRWDMLGTNEQTALFRYVKELGLTVEEMCKLIDDDWERLQNEMLNVWIDKHDKELIKRWNETVSNKDLVYILGDLSFRTGLETNEILKQLNGHKVLIKGNHENIWMDKDTDLSLFEEIVDYKEFDYQKHKFVLCHFPIQNYNKMDKGAIHLFGHIHSSSLQYPIKNAFNVGVDVNNYKPVNIEKYLLSFKDEYLKE